MACELGFQWSPPVQKGIAREEAINKYQFAGDEVQVYNTGQGQVMRSDG